MSRLSLPRARWLGCCLSLLLLLLGLASGVQAHRSGCHRWHSRPSDHGTYTCGDLGSCAQCPDNDYGAGGQPRGKAPHPPHASPTLQPQALTSQDTRVLRLDYEGFTIWLDCAKRGAVKFRYNAQRDQGGFKRQGHFAFDPDVPKHCQQTSTASCHPPPHRYDRGHLVPANHLDYARKAIRQSNYMTNILPQAATMNQGAWLLTEEIVECYRDIDELLVIGGVMWGSTAEDDSFVQSHGVTPPEAFWKLIVRGKDRVIAWIIPNHQDATRKRLDRYLVSVEELERQTGETFPEIPAFRRSEKPEVSWLIPIGCDKR